MCFSQTKVMEHVVCGLRRTRMSELWEKEYSVGSLREAFQEVCHFQTSTQLYVNDNLRVILLLIFTVYMFGLLGLK